MEVRTLQGPVVCRQCKKDVKTEIHKYVPCNKMFHPSCVKLHRKYEGTELVPCKGKLDIFVIKSNTNEFDGAGERGRERKASNEGGRAACSTMDSKIEAIYKMMKEIKDEMIGKDLLKKVITEAIDEEMDRVRTEIQTWKEAELESLVRDTIKVEMKKLAEAIPKLGVSVQEERKKSYSEAAAKKQEAVIIIKPVEEKDASSSEDTKRDIKNKIDIAKLGVGITKMKKVTKGAVVVGCENKRQADKLKEKVTKDLGEKYVIQTPMKKKLKIRIFDVDKEDSENEQDF